MSLIRKLLEKRDYGGGYLTGAFNNNYGLPPGAIPTNGMTGGALNGSGGFISIDQAMRHWAVFACVRIIADTISQLPIDQFKGDGEPIEPTDPRLIKPSAYATMSQWVWQVLASDLLAGNAYGLISDTDRLGYPRQVDLISPQGVCLEKDDKGRIVLRIPGKATPLQPGQFWYLPGPQMPGEIAGMSPIRYAAHLISLGLEAEKFGSDFFQNGINPTAVLETDQQVNADQATEIKQRVKGTMANHDIVVLGAGMKLNPWQISAQDAAYIDTQVQNAVSIAQIFGVPPEMLGAAHRGSSVTYANREQRAQDFLNNAINPWLARLEESLTAWFPRGTYVKFNTGALLRSDLLTRYQSYQLGIRNNFVLPSEARSLEDLPPLPGIDDKPLVAPPIAGGTDPGGSGGTGGTGNGSSDS